MQQSTRMYARGGELERGNCLSVRKRDTKALKPQRGADGIDTNAECAHRPRCANRTGRDRPGRAQRQAAKSLMEPNKTWSPAKSANKSQPHQPASILREECLPDISLKFKQSFPTPMRLIRLQQRCNLDSRKGGAYTSFHRICNSARPMETPLCRMCFLFLHSYWFVTNAKQLYLQNEGLSEIFWRRDGFSLT